MTDLIIKIVSIATAVITGVLAIYQRIVVIACRKKTDAEKATSEELANKLAQIQKIFEVYQSDLLDIMEKAEASGMTASAKKAFAKAQIVLLFNAMGIEYNDEQISGLIERLVSFSKKVNNPEIKQDEGGGF